MKKASKRLGSGLEQLEVRNLLTSVPFGAGTQDVAEFLLGDVAVNVVFMESNGALDESTEDWTDELRDGVKANIEEGLQWWVDELASHSDVHELNFEVDYTHADVPIETRYEPISRNSNDFRLWMEEFYRDVNVPSAGGFTTEIRNFNHQQRIAHDTNWSFTIVVVNAENDADGFFGDAQGNTTFKRAFAYPGGQFVVMPHHRPPATIAHELAHIFWAHDEYAGSDAYTAVRGYYGTQNTNAIDGHPDPESREPSLMYRTGAPYANHELSQSARETLGWRDSDGDGIFDVLDVPHITAGTAQFDAETRTVRFVGDSAVRTLDNKNPSGLRRDITLNKITDVQYRVGNGEWIDLAEYDDYQVSIDVTTPTLDADAARIEFRTIDDRIGVTSNVVGVDIPASEPSDPVVPILQNPLNKYDVSGDGHVSAIDALRVITAINNGVQPTTSGPPYLDVTGDGVISSRDVLLVINHINDSFAAANANAGFISSTLANDTIDQNENQAQNEELLAEAENSVDANQASATPIAAAAATDVVFQSNNFSTGTATDPTDDVTETTSSNGGQAGFGSLNSQSLALLALLSSNKDDDE